MNIIVCGQDRCGKSTLISQLREHMYHPVVIHSSAPPKSVPKKFGWEYNYYTSLTHLSNTNSGRHDFLFDRFHLGVHVYGTVYREYTKEEVELLFSVVEENFSNDTMLIVLTDNGCKIASRDDGASHEKSALEYEKTRQKFIEAYELSKLNKIMINITENGGFANTLPTVLKFIEERKCKE